MRLIYTVNKPNENPYGLSAYLKKQGIENEVEEVILPDAEPFYRIWVSDEEKVDKALKIAHEFEKNPSSDKFQNFAEAVVEIPEKNENGTRRRPRGVLSPSPYGKVTVFFLIACIVLFIAAELQRGVKMPPKVSGIIEAPVFGSVDRALIYDYPKYFELRDQFFKIYPESAIKENQPMPTDAKVILGEMQETPFWNGIYERVVNYFREKTPIAYEGPWFEKISQGEVWRIFTPILLHFNILHILFNLLWFILLGNQVEEKVGSFRYFLLIVFAALIPNTVQYLMSGPFFLGISGVVVALAGFIFARQQKAPWEGYLLNKMTLIFLFAFIFGMFGLQTIFFFVQILTNSNANLPIANTAHIVGGLVGYLLGRLNFFALKKRR